jgi:hypothetical protein
MLDMQHIDMARLERDLPQSSQDFAAAAPFPHVVLDDFLKPASCEGLLNDYLEAERAESWNLYHHYNERKEGLTAIDRMGSHARSVLGELAAPRFLHWIEELSGVDSLLWDPDLNGGGFHKTRRGGYLNVHTDFLAHPRMRNWSRQLNILIYLNHDWQPDYGGDLELWDAAMTKAEVSVAPLFNRCVIFHTTAGSFHGFSDPLTCPEDQFRRSLALYYFRDEDRLQSLKPTNYRARPHESRGTKVLVDADRLAVRLFSLAKRYTGLRDRHVSAVLRLFNKKH